MKNIFKGTTIMLTLLCAGGNMYADAGLSSKDQANELIAAAAQGEKQGADKVNILIDKGYSINAQNDEGNTVLHIALMNGNTDVATMLLKNTKIKIDKKNEKGHTPLHMAAAGMNPGDMIPLFFKHQKSVTSVINKKDENGNTPLHLALMNIRFIFNQNESAIDEGIKLFIDNGASISEENDNEQTPFIAMRNTIGEFVKDMCDNQ